MELNPRKYLLSAALLICMAAPAMAQDAETDCSVTPSEITKIREPEFGTSTMWDVIYAEEGMDVFTDMLALEKNEKLAVGAFTKDLKDEVYHPLIAKFDENMKTLWAVREETPEQRTIQRVIKTKDGFTVLGDLSDKARGNGIYIASYDDAGKMKGKPVPLYEEGGELDAKSFVAASDGTGYVIAAQFIDGKDAEKQYGLLYKISRSGSVLWKRSFEPGQSTVFNNIQTALDGSYIVAGQIVLNEHKSGGWLLRINDNGSIKWQRTYPRGMAASLQAVAQTKEGEFVVTGKARPNNYTGKGLTAWVMKTDSAGNPLWQRYFKGDSYSYEAPDVIVYEDGRASVLINGQGMDSEHRSHARIITFLPQGRVQGLEDYTEGQNASAHRIISGIEGERVLVGYAQTSFGEKQESNEASAAPVYTFDAWLVAAVPLEPFDDACAAGPSMSPILP